MGKLCPISLSTALVITMNSQVKVLNPDTSEEIYGYMDWREKEWEMHVVFTRDIEQDYLVIDEEPSYNWP
jgi:hypothetical protein